MLPALRSHEQYIKLASKLIENIHIPKVYDDVLAKLILIDLTPLRILFMPLYSSHHGRPAYAPEDMMRTFIAMVLCHLPIGSMTISMTNPVSMLSYPDFCQMMSLLSVVFMTSSPVFSRFQLSANRGI